MATTHPAKQPVKRTARRSTKRAAKLAATGSATAAEKIAADSKKRRSARRRGSSRKSPRQATKPEKKVFVLTLPLRTSKEDERKILGNLEIIRQIYNASLGEALKRLKRLRGSPEWKAACLLPKQVLGKDGKQHQNEERTAAFRAAHAKFGFTKSAIETFAIECKNRGGFLDRLGAPETQRMAERAFSAVQQYAFGARGRPRFKGLRGIHSLEGKSAAASLRWRDGHLCYGGMKLKALVGEKDQYACEAGN
jgi:RNA recognition motif-containing protein